jgi:hypothetical protein
MYYLTVIWSLNHLRKVQLQLKKCNWNELLFSSNQKSATDALFEGGWRDLRNSQST